LDGGDVSTNSETGLRMSEHRRAIDPSPEVAPIPLRERRGPKAPRVHEGGVGWLAAAFLVGAGWSYAVFAAAIYLGVTAAF
jgi:hypothetical protein